MPGKIQILPEHISKTIAAGEVVERPASVVKELIENAIDAGSSEIMVELKAGGLQLIRVYDNGEGIEPEDLPLALQRYATSKLKTVEDLYEIQTLGFRGEALPSIASVSQMSIKTRVPHALAGTRILCEGGEIKSVSEVGCPIGTEVEVKNLFYNMPVKRKFLKSIPSELRQSLNHFLKLSLSHPSISFKFIHDGRMLHEYVKTESPMVRIEAILGREVYDHLQAFEFEDGEIKVSGFTSLPSISKGTADGIYIYANQRYIRDRFIYKAILEGYRHVIPSGKFPVVILFVTLPPSAVDVNVHPTKAEVKFKEQERVFQAVTRALRSIYGRGSFSTEVMIEGERRDEVFSKTAPVSLLLKKSYSNDPPWETWNEGKMVSMVSEGLRHGWREEGRTPFRILGQVQGTYILCEGEEGVVFIDQHAAHERILFERYKRQYETRSVPLTKFLIPIQMEVSAEESFIVSSHLEVFQSMGFEMDPMGKNTYALRSIPSFIDQKDAKEMVREILEELSFLKKMGKMTETIHTILVTMACHSAIRGNFMLKREEMNELVKTLTPFNLSTTCPHGRPIFFLFDLDALKKQFKRN
ncbi:MAG: DNA mismatch repair endonuclease MutL [Thermodesulfobacteriota bacterium]